MISRRLQYTCYCSGYSKYNLPVLYYWDGSYIHKLKAGQSKNEGYKYIPSMYYILWGFVLIVKVIKRRLHIIPLTFLTKINFQPCITLSETIKLIKIFKSKRKYSEHDKTTQNPKHKIKSVQTQWNVFLVPAMKMNLNKQDLINIRVMKSDHRNLPNSS
jgi:hypothetical protein